jgi:hypothetical protein
VSLFFDGCFGKKTTQSRSFSLYHKKSALTSPRKAKIMIRAMIQIAVYRPGALPLDPTKELFEKSSLESQKLLKTLLNIVF